MRKRAAVREHREAGAGRRPARAGPPHFVYLLRCGDRTYYIGYTTDPLRRLAAHRNGRGARYTRGRGPLRLLAVWRCLTIGAAFRLERRLKQLPRTIKARLAAGGPLPGRVSEALRGAAAARIRRSR